MGSIGDLESTQYEKLWHRKQCSNRLFIGPWDLNSPTISNEQAEIDSAYSEQYSQLQSLPESTSTVQQQFKPPPLVTQSSDGTSFITARSKNTNVSSGVFSPFQSEDLYGSDEEDECGLLGYGTSDIASATHDLSLDRASTHTVRPNPKPPLFSFTSQLPQTTTAIDSHLAKPTHILKKNRQRLESRALLWKQAGSLFISRKRTHPPEQLIAQATGATLKQGPVVCMRTVTDRIGSGPTRYKASKESRYSLLTEKWKQVELVLTRSYISAYSSSTLFWPKHRLEYRIHFDGARKPKGLELFLFSPIDYTFGLRYPSMAGKIPTTVVLLFKARTFLQCQEWYMQLYRILPASAKRPFPPFCEVYIPKVDLTLNLPLEETEGCYDITLHDVKNAVLSVIEADGHEILDEDALCLCWSTKERVEWKQSTMEDGSTDSAICPQSIERTHRLELRQVEHSPTTLLLNQDITLKEPMPVEGFLVCTSNFFGLAVRMARRPQYFASFDQYLLSIPSLKVTEPTADAVVAFPDTRIPDRLRTVPHLRFLSPYAHPTASIVEGEIQRRMSLLTESKGMIDLTEVSFVRRRFHTDTPVADDSQTGMLRPYLHETPSCTLELIMENGLHVQFEAYSAQTCEVWAHSLSQLVLYWKARKEAKGEAHLQKQMADSLLNEKNDTTFGCCHDDGSDSARADTRIWSFCLYDQCRDVVKSGILYYKPHHRGTYTKKFFILAANGWLLFFDVFNRMVQKKSNHHERKGAVDIAGCYFYSGVDCSKKRKGSNMAKVYESHLKAYSSGLVTHDTPMTCVFSIWKPAIRKYFSPKQQRLRVYHQDQRLNPKGQNIMFLAQSQGEKEEWLYALNSVAEHMMQASSP